MGVDCSYPTVHVSGYFILFFGVFFNTAYLLLIVRFPLKLSVLPRTGIELTVSTSPNPQNNALIHQFIVIILVLNQMAHEKSSEVISISKANGLWEKFRGYISLKPNGLWEKFHVYVCLKIYVLWRKWLYQSETKWFVRKVQWLYQPQTKWLLRKVQWLYQSQTK